MRGLARTRKPNEPLQGAAALEYRKTVSASIDPAKPADTRRILTDAHLKLQSAIQSYRRTYDDDALRAAMVECRKWREVWT
jgi:hypothetical protein